MVLKIISGLAIAFSFYMIAFMWHGLVDVFRMADPTGWFGISTQVAALTGNICVIFVAGLVLLQKQKDDLIQTRVAIIIFVIKGLEALSLMPCVVGIGDAFCGLYWVLFTNFSAPLVVIITAMSIIASGKKPVMIAGLNVALLLVIGSLVAFLMATPKTPKDCMALSLTGSAACLERFAMKSGSDVICRQIEFRSTRFQCLRKIAAEKGKPEICEAIVDASGVQVAPYEAPALETKDLCYYTLGFKLRDKTLCQKVTDPKMQDTCLTQVPGPGQKRKLY